MDILIINIERYSRKKMFKYTIINFILFIFILGTGIYVVFSYAPIFEMTSTRDTLEEANYHTATLFSTYQVVSGGFESDELIFDENVFIYDPVRAIINYDGKQMIVNVAMTLESVHYDLGYIDEDLINGLQPNEIILSKNIASSNKIDINDQINYRDQVYVVKGFIGIHTLIQIKNEPYEFGLMIIGDDLANHVRRNYVHLGNDAIDAIEDHNGFHPDQTVYIYDVSHTPIEILFINRLIRNTLIFVMILYVFYYVIRYQFMDRSYRYIHDLYDRGIHRKIIHRHLTVFRLGNILPSVLLLGLMLWILSLNITFAIFALSLLLTDGLAFKLVRMKRGHLFERFRN